MTAAASGSIPAIVNLDATRRGVHLIAMLTADTIEAIERRGQELARLIESAQPPSRRLTIGQAQGVVEKVRGWPPSYNTIRNWAISHKIGELLPHGGWVIFEDRLLRIMGAD